MNTITITIYGCSDDLIEFEGDLREEVSWYNESQPCHIAVSDGTLLSVIYDKDGIWRINRLAAGSAEYQKIEGNCSERDYSDRVTLSGQIVWLTCKDSAFFVGSKGGKL